MADRILTVFSKVSARTDLEYWIDSATLMMGVYGVYSERKSYNICILDYDEYDFLDMRYSLSEFGFDIMSYEGGYKIVEKMNYRPVTEHDTITNKIYGDNNDNATCLNIIVTTKSENNIIYKNPALQKKWHKNFHDESNLFPLKIYKIKENYLKGPKNPMPYINRVFAPSKNQKSK